jgi:hypothetical protein
MKITHYALCARISLYRRGANHIAPGMYLTRVPGLVLHQIHTGTHILLWRCSVAQVILFI